MSQQAVGLLQTGAGPGKGRAIQSTLFEYQVGLQPSFSWCDIGRSDDVKIHRLQVLRGLAWQARAGSMHIQLAKGHRPPVAHLLPLCCDGHLEHTCLPTPLGDDGLLQPLAATACLTLPYSILAYSKEQELHFMKTQLMTADVCFCFGSNKSRFGHGF